MRQAAAIKQQTRIADIEAWVIERYIRDGKDSTVAEIAAGMGISETSVRRDIAEANDIAYSVEYRTSYSTNYRGFEHGSHKVGVYGPTRKTLARIIREGRAA